MLHTSKHQKLYIFFLGVSAKKRLAPPKPQLLAVLIICYVFVVELEWIGTFPKPSLLELLLLLLLLILMSDQAVTMKYSTYVGLGRGM